MKLKKIMFLYFVLFLFSANLNGSVSHSFLRFWTEKEGVEEELKNKTKTLNPENIHPDLKALKEELGLDDSKYIPVQDNKFEYFKTAFYDANYFYLGADPDFVDPGNSFNYALARTSFVYFSNDILQITPMAPRHVYLNGGGVGPDCPRQSINPIYNNGITNLTLSSRFPVVTLSKSFEIDDVNFGPNQLICLVSDFSAGGAVRTNVVKINDSSGNPTSKVVGLAASSDAIFAAVNPNGGGTFGQAGSGFASLVTFDNKLKPLDVANGTSGPNLAVNLDLTADQLLAITQDALVGDVALEGLGDIYWDPTLNRLFIGLVDVRRSNNANPGGVVSILVARFDKGKLIIEPCVDLDSSFFTLNSLDFIFGFYFNNASDVNATVKKIRTMHTSTALSYMIINGSTQDNNSLVYAVPIVGKDNADETIGRVADKTTEDFDEIVIDINGMSLATEGAVLVGGSSLPIPADGNVQDMFVVNDAVFVCVNGDRLDANSESGIFRSTALFDENGKIRGWSSWQRVMGNTDSVFGAGLDRATGSFWYLTQDDSLIKNTAKVTRWGESSAFPELMGNGLVGILKEEFSFCDAGVHQIFNFDEFTPGFHDTDRFSMMVATGKNKVALIETGRHITNGVDAFSPTQEFIKDQNVFIFEDGDLENFGPICCAEVSRTTNEFEGWVFAGGNSGLLVLRNSNGIGWDADEGLDKLSPTGFPGDGNFSFKKLIKNDGNSFFKVRKLLAQETDGKAYLYVMTVDKIYRILMDTDKFDDAVTNPLDERVIKSPPGSLLDMIIFYSDGQQVGLLAATTSGLFYSGPIDGNDTDQDVSWSAVTLKSGVPLRGVVGHLDFLSTEKGGYTRDGNLYVLASDISLNLANIYRFDVDQGSIVPIFNGDGTDYFYSFGELRNNFVTDGALGFSLLSKHFEQDTFLRRISMLPYQLVKRRSEIPVNLGVPLCSKNVGVMVLNTASGGWVVPGDWGISVNE